MAWNEPGGNNRDPWSGGPRGGKGPDLDDLLKQMGDKFGRVFGGGGKGSSAGFGLLLAAVAAVWALSGIYIVDEGERGVVLRFGEYVDTTMPGPHWHMPYPIEKVETVDVDSFRSVQLKGQMLTEDENIVQVDLGVQYNISDPAEYLFNVRDADLTLRAAAESAIREVVGKSSMDFALTQGRSEIAARVRTLLQEMMDGYKAGILIRTVNLQDAQPPEAVQAAFEDAIKAREDEQRFINEAEAYANEIIPRARGNAIQQVEEARAYRAQVTKAAEGEAERFSKLYAEYRKAPEVTRERLYLDAVESVLTNSSKVMMDVEGGNNIMYLPLDKIVSQASGAAATSGMTTGGDTTRRPQSTPSTAANDNNRVRDLMRSREVR